MGAFMVSLAAYGTRVSLALAASLNERPPTAEQLRRHPAAFARAACRFARLDLHEMLPSDPDLVAEVLSGMRCALVTG